MKYRFLVEDTNRIYELLTKAKAEPDYDRVRTYEIEAALIAGTGLNRLLHIARVDNEFHDLDHSAWGWVHSSELPEVLENIEELLWAESRLLSVAGMEEAAANQLVNETRITILKAMEQPDSRALAKNIVENLLPALYELEQQDVELAKQLMKEQEEAEEQQKKEQEEAEEQKRKRKLWKKAFLGVGGAAIIGVNAALGTSFLIPTGGAVVPITAVSSVVGGGLINEVALH